MTQRTFVVAGVLALGLAGCGGHPRHAGALQMPLLPRQVARQLAATSDVVAARLDAGDGCGALTAAKELQRRMIVAVNSREVPGPLQEPLGNAVAGLTVRIRCIPPAPDRHGQRKHKGDRHNHQGEGGGD